MTARKKQDREGPVHKSILEYLRYALPGALIHHSPNELDLGNGDGDESDKQRRRQAKAIAQNKAKSKGMMPGFPDLMVLWRGRFLAIEVKAGSNRADPQQEDVGALIEKNGGRWAVAWDLDDAQRVVRAWRQEVQP